MSKPKSLSFLAQVQIIRANIDRDGNVIDRTLMLTALNPKPSSTNGLAQAYPPGYGSPYGPSAEGAPFPLTLSPADSNTIKSGDWLSVQVTQLSEADQDQLAKTLVERSETLAKIEQLRNADNEESRALMKRMVETMEKQVKRMGPQFGDDE